MRASPLLQNDSANISESTHSPQHESRCEFNLGVETTCRGRMHVVSHWRWWLFHRGRVYFCTHADCGSRKPLQCISSLHLVTHLKVLSLPQRFPGSFSRVPSHLVNSPWGDLSGLRDQRLPASLFVQLTTMIFTIGKAVYFPPWETWSLIWPWLVHNPWTQEYIRN